MSDDPSDALALPTQAQLDALPIFPLGGAVFFPHTLLPLHIFEPRYRAMTRFCIDHRWPMAIAMSADALPGGVGSPPVAPVVGVGELVHHEVTPDGRYHIMLRGLARAQVLGELDPVDGYRRVRAALYDDARPDDLGAFNVLRTSIEGCLTALSPRLPEPTSKALNGWMRTVEDPTRLTFGLASALALESAERQRLLALQDPVERASVVLDRLTDMLIDGADGDVLH